MQKEEVLIALQTIYIIKDSDLDLPDVPQPVAGSHQTHDPEPIASEASQVTMQELVPLASSSALENYGQELVPIAETTLPSHEEILATINKDLAPLSAPVLVPAEKRQRTEEPLSLFDLVPDTADAVSRSEQLQLANRPRIIGRECSVALTSPPTPTK